ncbi:MAG: 4-alpha-glucanotransferase [Deltaproteobacteria bacterium]|nr:4-alpha-glucanotransferase [Deltaproteobacteria bacterium]
MTRRSSGILLHVTSLPSPFGIGDMGPGAYRYVDFLSETGQALWQILPLNPTDTASFDSPYHSTSAFACNPLLISPEFMVRDGLLSPSDLEPLPAFPLDRVDYHAVSVYKKGLFQKAFEAFRTGSERPDYRAFCEENAFWLEDFALYMALRRLYEGKTWREWPPEIRQRRPDALREARERLSESLEKERFLQYLFLRQWSALRAYANGKGIRILGDIPIYVVYDSADLWAHPEIFNLDGGGRPLTVAGVPPDYFSETGQLWGNPVFRWGVMRETGYGWWIQRMGQNLKLFDLMRLDHFRGFAAYWEVPADEEDAVRGKWVEAPGLDFFERITRWFPSLSLIAEDLGTITPDVTEMMNHFGFPGMKVLLFALTDDRGANPYLPHNHVRNCVVYTGTHDNNTVRGWFDGEAADEEKRRLFLYLGREVSSGEIHWEMIRLAMMSVADRVVFPMQDLLGLGTEARMNRPGKKDGNWQWRLLQKQLAPPLARKLLEMTRAYGRTG